MSYALLALLPIASVVLVWAMRRSALRGEADPARAWFGFWRAASAVLAATWPGWLALLWLTGAYGAVSRTAAPLGMWGVVLAQMAVSFLPPALVSIAVAALSHRVAARLRGSEWTLRQTLASATWGSLGLMGTVTAIAIAVPAVMTGHPGLAAAAVLGAVALRWATLRGQSRALDLAPHAVTAGPLRDRVFELAARARVPLRMLYVVPAARGRVANAFAVRGQLVMLTDYLLEHLSRREVDAVIAHELTHLGRGHLRKLALAQGLVVALGLAAGYAASPAILVPVLVLVALLVGVAAMRRFEREADAGAVALTGDPEATISALARITRLNTMPLDWGKWTGRWLTHPSTRRRARAIAERAGLSEARVEELLRDGCGDATRHPMPAVALDGGKVFSTRFKTGWAMRLSWTLSLAMTVTPAAVVALAALATPRAPSGPVFLLMCAAAVAATLAVHDLLAARPYAALRRPLLERLAAAGAEAPGALLVGLSPGALPRVFEGFGDWDVGALSMRGDRLCYWGEETRFAVRRDQIVRLRLGARMPGWVSAPRVVVELAEGSFSLRPIEAARVSAGTVAARRLLDALCAWMAAGGTPTSVPPRPALDALDSPALGPVTCVTPAQIASPAALLPAVVILGLCSAVASALFSLPLGLLGRLGALDVLGAALVALLVQRLPWWAYRERRAPAPAAPRQDRAAA